MIYIKIDISLLNILVGKNLSTNPKLYNLKALTTVDK